MSQRGYTPLDTPRLPRAAMTAGRRTPTNKFVNL